MKNYKAYEVTFTIGAKSKKQIIDILKKHLSPGFKVDLIKEIKKT